MNSYGFAEGDPVNFNDPFGLKVECKTKEACALWDQLKSAASAAARSKDQETAALGQALQGMIDAVTNAEATLTIDVGDRWTNWLDGGGYTKSRVQGPGVGASISLDQGYVGNKLGLSGVTALAHEVGHAYAYMTAQIDLLNSSSLVGENAIRRLERCANMRTQHNPPVPRCR